MTTGTTWRKFDAAPVLFLIRSWEIDETVDRRPHHGAHLDWLAQGHDDGRLLLSGPSSDRTLGIYLVAAESAESARAYVATDPYHVIGVRGFDVTEWEVQRRSMTPGLAEDDRRA